MKSSSLLIAIHVIAWLLFFSLMISFIVTSSSEAAGYLQTIISLPFLLFGVIFIFLFYFNAYCLIPLLYFKQRYALYFIIILLLFVAVYYLKPFDQLIHQDAQQSFQQEQPPPLSQESENELRPPLLYSDSQKRLHPPPLPPAFNNMPPQRPRTNGRTHPDIISLILFVMICSLSWGLQMVKKWRTVEERATKAEAEKTEAELAFLKAQINPHFLFNTLNNIYSLAATNDENTADSVMKLSNIMRYVTDEVSEDFVPLEGELAFINDYIDLQYLRLNNKTSVNFSVEGKIAGKRIAPLILMPFIENVFKYGTSNHEPSAIVIQLIVVENRLRFFCQNTIFSNGKKEERTGVGIENTKHRLEYLYTNKHSLHISTLNGLYTVDLSLQL